MKRFLAETITTIGLVLGWGVYLLYAIIAVAYTICAAMIWKAKGGKI